MSSWQRWLSRWWQRRLPAATLVRLGQPHIFVLPTGAGYGFAVALLLILLLAINYQNSLAYGLVFILSALGLLSVLHCWRNLAGLQLQALPVKPCFAGQDAVFVFSLQSPQADKQALSIGWPGQQGQLLDVSGDRHSQVELLAPAKQRGWFAAPRMQVETRYPLGLWRAWSRVALKQQVLVYPQPIFQSVTDSGQLGSEQLDGLLDTGRSGLDDYRGLEAWQPSDSLRRVDWKAWSRGQGLWTKHFAEQSGSNIELDFSRLTGDAEHRLSLLCAQVLTLSEQQLSYILLLPDQRLGPSSGQAFQEECLRALALFNGGANAG